MDMRIKLAMYVQCNKQLNINMLDGLILTIMLELTTLLMF